MGRLDRSIFLDNQLLNSEDQMDDIYSLKAHKFTNGVDVTNPMMQALLLDCIHASIKGCNMTEVNLLDVGTATGFLSYAACLLNQFHYKLDSFKATGVDLNTSALKKAKSIKNRDVEVSDTVLFMEDDFFKHFEFMNKYNLVVSGCGMLHSDLLGSIYQKSEVENDLVVISPIFLNDSEQSLRIHFPTKHTDTLLEELNKVVLFDNLQAKEITDETSSVDLFTCFFSPLEYPDLENKSNPIELDMNFSSVGIDLDNPVPQPTDFKKLNIEEITELLQQKEEEFKQIFLEMKLENPTLSLADINELEDCKVLLEDINLLKRYKVVKESI